MKRRFPIGIQDFVKIREEAYCYVDKTARIHELLSGPEGTYFLSRPRRFGKSLLCSTLGALFEGRRELFAATAGQPALAIDSLDWEWKKYPVIRLDLNPGNYERGLDELLATLNRAIDSSAEKYEVPAPGASISDRFIRLIAALSRRYGERVAIIIDEYDKPLLNTIDTPDIHKEIRSTLKAFYGALKSSDEHLRFVFLTGVTKFSQVSIFSDLNNLIDLSLDPHYADLCGITQEEMERNFEPEIERIAADKHLEKQAYLADLKHFYNGYRFSKNPLTVYNPFGLLNHFYSNGVFDTYWFATGTPSFLIKLIENQKINILNLEQSKVSLYDFHKFDVENMDAVPVLYQSGYLTIVDYDEERSRFVLDYPNEDVRVSFAKSLVETYFHAPSEKSQALSVQLPDTLFDGDIEGAINALRTFLASIPYDLVAKTENYYQTVVHLIFTMMGLYCRSEVRIAGGRIDTLVETKKYVYCFEFKIHGTAEEALRQIDTKEYLLPWAGSGKKLFKAGVIFDTKKRTIGNWKADIEAEKPPASSP
jgi:hypothetical protein